MLNDDEIMSIMSGKTLPEQDRVGVAQDTDWTLPIADSDKIDNHPSLTVYAFNGDFIGLGSTYRPVHFRHTNTPYMESSSGLKCNRCRWFELRLFYSNSETCYVLHFAGRTMVPGEIQRYRIEKALTAYEIIEILSAKAAHGQPSRNDPAFEARLTAPGLRALSQAAGFDDDIRDAFNARVKKL